MKLVHLSIDIALLTLPQHYGRKFVYVTTEYLSKVRIVSVHTGKPIECCDPDGRAFSPRYEHPFCMTIKVPPNDPYYSERDVTCLSYVRSAPALGPDCSMGPMEQVSDCHLKNLKECFQNIEKSFSKK